MPTSMKAPAGVNQAYGLSGTLYVPDANQNISAQSPDVPSLIAAGWGLNVGNVNPALNGLTPTRIPLIEFKNSAGTTLAGSAGAGVFGISDTPGTSGPLLTSEAANNNTKTDIAMVEVILPITYNGGQNISLLVNANYVPGAGTVGTHTLAAAAYRATDAGVQGANLIATAAQLVPATTPADLTFTINGATLLPRDRIVITLTLVIQESAAGGNITALVNSARLQ